MLFREISQIPEVAERCFIENRKLILPRRVPYLGMGASYFAALTISYCQADIHPYLASEYYYYFSSKILPRGVFISQSGETSEVLWNISRFRSIVGVSNNPQSSLLRSRKAEKKVLLYAGREQSAASKTYINTLMVLFLGLRFDPRSALSLLQKKFHEMRDEAREQARFVRRFLQRKTIGGLYVLGAGPNTATAYEAALALSETTKLPWMGLSVSQYDHGFKEASRNSLLIVLESRGRELNRIEHLCRLLRKKTPVSIVHFSEKSVPEALSPILLITRVYWMMYYLVDALGITETYRVGAKITRTSIR